MVYGKQTFHEVPYIRHKAVSTQNDHNCHSIKPLKTLECITGRKTHPGSYATGHRFKIKLRCSVHPLVLEVQVFSLNIELTFVFIPSLVY